MTHEEKRLLKALRELPHITQFHIRAAYSLLNINGLKDALAYIEAVKNGQQPTLPLEVAEDLHLDDMAYWPPEE